MKPQTRPQIRDETVLAKTGKRWVAWFDVLDRAGAAEWKHRDIARHLGDGYELDSWWRQAVAVAYEQARGLRDKYEMADGYQVEKTKTLARSAEAVWQALANPEQRCRWLPEAADARVRQEQPEKFQIRLDWPGGRSRVWLGVRKKARDKCVVGVQHSKLPDRESADRMNRYWAEKLAGLGEIV